MGDFSGTCVRVPPVFPTRIVGVPFTASVSASVSNSCAVAAVSAAFRSELNACATFSPGVLAATAAIMSPFSQPVFSVPWFR